MSIRRWFEDSWIVQAAFLLWWFVTLLLGLLVQFYWTLEKFGIYFNSFCPQW